MNADGREVLRTLRGQQRLQGASGDTVDGKSLLSQISGCIQTLPHLAVQAGQTCGIVLRLWEH